MMKLPFKPQIYVDVLPVISTFLPINKEYSALTNI